MNDSDFPGLRTHEGTHAAIEVAFGRSEPVVVLSVFSTSEKAPKRQEHCSQRQGQLGVSLFKKFANETDNVYRPLPYVPTIVGDQPYDYYEQDDWLQHFERKFVERYEAKFGVKLIFSPAFELDFGSGLVV
uniref:Uncharacterized protein n=1 Tax=Anopheles culicifacies TaxID=139723 RepID=A0A182M446_9DIPT